MITVQPIVQANAVLVYLHDLGRPATLGELAAHFGIPWRKLLDILWAANTAETGMPDLPVTLDLPLPADQLEPGEHAPSPHSSVALVDGALEDISLTLDEALVVIALLDSVAEVTPLGAESLALAQTRGEVARAVRDAGFGSVLWSPPEEALGGPVAAAINDAVVRNARLSFTYPSPRHPDGIEVTAVPVDVVPGAAPVLRAYEAGAVRHYRLDRMADARVGAAVDRETRAEAVAAARREPAWQPKGTSVRLTIRPGARWVAESAHATAVETGPDEIVVQLNARSDEWLASLLGQIGEDLVRVEPPAVAGRMADIFDRLARPDSEGATAGRDTAAGKGAE